MTAPRSWFAPALMAGLVLLACAFGVGARFWFPDMLDRMEALLAATRGLGTVGWLAFVAAEILIAVVGFIPASLFGIVAGAVYGIGLGFGLAALGICLGAVISFALSRSLFRGAIIRFLDNRRRLGALDARVRGGGWVLVCLLRASPVMPFAITSLLLGVSAVRFRDYLIGTLAALPALLGYVCVGRLSDANLTASGATGGINVALLAFGAVATVLLTARIGAMMRSSQRETARP